MRILRRAMANGHLLRRRTVLFVGVCWAATICWCDTPCRAGDGASDVPLFDETKAVTLFAFDDISIPLTQNLRLEMNSPDRHPDNPVVQRGQAGEPDSWAVQFYGSVIREGEKFRMWYVAVGADRLDPATPRSSPWRVAYAESEDGIHWVKPNLGLVQARGSRDNNLVLMEPRLGTVNLKVLRDPHDPDPERRYKMGAHVWFPKNDVRLGTLAPYASADGSVVETVDRHGSCRRRIAARRTWSFPPCISSRWAGSTIGTVCSTCLVRTPSQPHGRTTGVWSGRLCRGTL